MKLTLHEIANVVGAKNDVTIFEDVAVEKIEFDSRLIGEGDLFLPLQGARDGHDFIEVAFENGAVATFSEKEMLAHPHLLVDNCLTAFQTLAAYYLEKTRVDVIAVTGSNGKTTTKDMIHDILATTYKAYKTQGNYNNEIGLPHTVLHMPDDTEKIVLEMGQDHMGDIHLLSEIAKPKLAVVTLIGEAHLEFFGSRDKIAKGKLQIADGMTSGSTLVVPSDPIVDPYLPMDRHVVRFGERAELSVSELWEYKDRLIFETNFLNGTIELPVTGKYNATNAMVAAYVAKLEGVSEDNILSALRHLQLTKNRTEWKKAGNGADILSDVYNANPTAMKLILETFSSIPANDGGKKKVVLADMKELGPDSVALHNQIIMSLAPDLIDTVIFYGQDIAELAQLASQMFPIGHVYHFQKSDEMDQFDHMLEKIKDILQPKDQILLKGSNSMNLSKIVEELEK
ncbi:UDP-N-acetylmuramoyl-tripeptide--D-alanyl-D-alanine ligase [Streptococcus sp. X16XC17]|uniref:UDP-N-acetylmuramoyl-tripeptide--D-alanyl-D- alanine ligase n=1 Tax=unclassified Streptococcus TaxID=2608887 RepID=UPI00066FD982|nr:MULTISPECIES: UDP-N-acetylmuramoyl-tripeptide--D-alanyl-D-alanine ligase [unclassified Streptococcus]TCD46764.1 UDP-N-acetylmuramoyl-tripeptide--D-alanyl-D-alanine ligase [Streptococcus sp. X16XC17]